MHVARRRGSDRKPPGTRPGLTLKDWLPTEPRMKRQRVALTQWRKFPGGMSRTSRQPSRKMEKPDEKKLGRAGISMFDSDYKRSAPGCQFRHASPTRPSRVCPGKKFSHAC